MTKTLPKKSESGSAPKNEVSWQQWAAEIMTDAHDSPLINAAFTLWIVPYLNSLKIIWPFICIIGALKMNQKCNKEL